MALEADSKIHVTVIVSDPIRQIGLSAILNSDPEFEVSSRCGTADEHPKACIALLGTAAGSGDVCADLARLREDCPDSRIILIGVDGRDGEILRALTAGAKGYIHESAAPDEFKQAIRAVHEGLVWAPPRVLSMFVERATLPPGSEPQAIPHYTQRERDVLQLLVEGHTNREIGAALGIETRTVKAHVGHLMNKTGVKNRIALSVFAITRAVLAGSK
jgi:DNA-binding NarL/FixJ family response regulator